MALSMNYSLNAQDVLTHPEMPDRLQRMRRAGVQHIEISDACTMCSPDVFWSHRVTKGERGSQGAIIQCREVSR